MRTIWTLATGQVDELSNDTNQDPDQDKLDGLSDVNDEPDFAGGSVTSAYVTIDQARGWARGEDVDGQIGFKNEDGSFTTLRDWVVGAQSYELSAEPIGYDSNDIDDFDTGTSGPTIEQTKVDPDNSIGEVFAASVPTPDDSIRWMKSQRLAALDPLTPDEKEAIHLWTIIKVNNPISLPDPEHDGFRYAFHKVMGDPALYRHYDGEDGFQHGEMLGITFLNGVSQHSRPTTARLYRAMGLNTDQYNYYLQLFQKGSVDLPPASWTIDATTTELFGRVHSEWDPAAFDQRVLFVAEKGTLSWAIGMSSKNASQRERIVGGRFKVDSIHRHENGDDQTTIVYLTQTDPWPEDWDMADDLIEHMVFDEGEELTKTSGWIDVRDKAKRIRADGGVRIISSTGRYVSAHVRGDDGVYETTLERGPSHSIDQWTCSCPWFAYSFGRSGRWKKYEGRMCSHALALQYQAQSEGMFGKDIHEQADAPKWDKGDITYYEPPPPKDWRVAGLEDPHGMSWQSKGPKSWARCKNPQCWWTYLGTYDMPKGRREKAKTDFDRYHSFNSPTSGGDWAREAALDPVRDQNGYEVGEKPTGSSFGQHVKNYWIHGDGHVESVRDHNEAPIHHPQGGHWENGHIRMVTQPGLLDLEATGKSPTPQALDTVRRIIHTRNPSNVGVTNGPRNAGNVFRGPPHELWNKTHDVLTTPTSYQKESRLDAVETTMLSVWGVPKTALIDPATPPQPQDDPQWADGSMARIYPMHGQTDTKNPQSIDTDLRMHTMPVENRAGIEQIFRDGVGVTPRQALHHLVKRFDRVTPEEREDSAQWYHQAHFEARDVAAQSGMNPHNVMGVYAATSPGALWHVNQQFARSIVNRVQNQDEAIPQQHIDSTNELLRAPRKKTLKDGTTIELPPLTDYQIPQGATYRDVFNANTRAGAVAIGKHDHLPVGYGYGNIEKGLKIALGKPGSVANILEGAKVRSFFNNIENPWSHRDVTIDSHMWRSFAADPDEDLDTVGKRIAHLDKSMTPITGGGPKLAGAKVGAYPIGADLLRMATGAINAKHGTSYTPSQVQAILWINQRNQWNIGAIRNATSPRQPAPAQPSPLGAPQAVSAAKDDPFTPWRLSVYWGEPDDEADETHLVGGRWIHNTEEATATAPAKTAAGADHSGIMVAVRPPENICQQLALGTDGAEDLDQLHVTLAYIPGEVAQAIDLDLLRQVVASEARLAVPIQASYTGYGLFEGDGTHKPVVALVDSEELAEARRLLVASLERAGIEISHQHGFLPHTTLTYNDVDFESLPPLDKTPFHFDAFIISPPSNEWEYFPIQPAFAVQADIGDGQMDPAISGEPTVDAEDWDQEWGDTDALSAGEGKTAAIDWSAAERGTPGNRSHITYEERGTLPIEHVRHMLGASDEVPGHHRNMRGQDWEDFKGDVKQNGVKNPIFITQYPGRGPRLSEGNHRRDAAVEVGMSHIPVQIRYFGHSEQDGLVGRPHEKPIVRNDWDGKPKRQPTAQVSDSEDPTDSPADEIEEGTVLPGAQASVNPNFDQPYGGAEIGKYLYHHADPKNRESIQQHGLTAHDPTEAGGSAHGLSDDEGGGHNAPAGVYFGPHEHAIGGGRDVWAVDTNKVHLHPDPGDHDNYWGFHYSPHDVPPHALKLIHRAALGDPDPWDEQEVVPDIHVDEAAPKMAELHDEPEPALPSTDSSDETYSTDEQNNTHLMGDDEGASFSTIAMRPAWLDPANSSEGVREGDMDIAAAARNYLMTSTAVKSFTYAEQQEIINEGDGTVTASNLDRLHLEGTHYERLEEQLARAEAIGEPVLWW